MIALSIARRVGTRNRRHIYAILGLVLFLGTNAMADDNLLRLPPTGWRLVTDGVMGGVSSGALAEASQDGLPCMRLQGQVSTANNGGFIQAAQDIAPAVSAGLEAFDGVRVMLRGNGESYNIHLRTSDLWLPWQSFRLTAVATDEWRTLRLPFADFTSYKTRVPLRPERLRRLGIVAIGRDFAADVCIGEVGFFRRAPE